MNIVKVLVFNSDNNWTHTWYIWASIMGWPSSHMGLACSPIIHQLKPKWRFWVRYAISFQFFRPNLSIINQFHSHQLAIFNLTLDDLVSATLIHGVRNSEASQRLRNELAGWIYTNRSFIAKLCSGGGRDWHRLRRTGRFSPEGSELGWRCLLQVLDHSA